MKKLTNLCIDCIINNPIKIDILPKHLQKYIINHLNDYKYRIINHIDLILEQLFFKTYVLKNNCFSNLLNVVTKYVYNDLKQKQIIFNDLLNSIITLYIKQILIINMLSINMISCYDYLEQVFNLNTIKDIKLFINTKTFKECKMYIINYLKSPNIIFDEIDFNAVDQFMLSILNKIIKILKYDINDTLYYIDIDYYSFKINKYMLIINEKGNLIYKAHKLLSLYLDYFKYPIQNKKNIFRKFTTFFKGIIQHKYKYLVNQNFRSFDIEVLDNYSSFDDIIYIYQMYTKRFVFIDDIFDDIYTYMCKLIHPNMCLKNNQLYNILYDKLIQLFSIRSIKNVIHPLCIYNDHKHYETKYELQQFYKSFNL